MLKQILVSPRFGAGRGGRSGGQRTRRRFPDHAVRVVDDGVAHAGERNSIDSIVTTGIGVDKCSCRTDRSTRRTHRDSRPTVRNRDNWIVTTAATAALFLDDRIFAGGERLVRGHREDDWISAHNLIARCGRKVDCNRGVRDNRAGIVCNSHRNSVGRYGTKRKPCLRGNRECINRRLDGIDGVNRIAATATTLTEIADLDGVERPHARRCCRIRDGEVRRCARGREYADDGSAIGIVHAVMGSVDVNRRRVVNRDERAAGCPVGNELNEVGLARCQPL